MDSSQQKCRQNYYYPRQCKARYLYFLCTLLSNPCNSKQDFFTAATENRKDKKQYKKEIISHHLHLMGAI